MKIELFFIFLCSVILFISYMTYNINLYMGYSLDLKEINSQKKNYKIEVPTTINNLIKIKEKYLIACEFKPLDLYINNLYLRNIIENEKIYLINTENEKFSEIKIKKFPDKIPFHPHGISLFIKEQNNYILYILNHAVNYDYVGQERVEKFNIIFEGNSISLIYDSSIILPDEFFLRVDSIIFLKEDKFIFTTNKAYEIPKDSDELIDSFTYLYYKMNNILEIINPFINIKKCFIYLYDKEEISIIDNSQSISYRGIAYDNKRKLLYVVKPYEKEINIFEENNNEFKLIKTISTLYVGNNIFYDNKNDIIILGINGKKSEEETIIKKIKNNNSIENVETYSGYEILNPENNYSIGDLMLMKKKDFKWINSAVYIKGKIYMSSIYSKGILVYESDN